MPTHADRPQPFSRISVLALLTLPVLLSLAWIGWIERSADEQARQRVQQDATRSAENLAGVIAGRLQTQFTELQFIAVALLGPDADPTAPDPETVQTLRRFMALHPSLYAFNIQSPDGNTLLWSTQTQSSRPITAGAAFTPLPSNPDFLIGQDQYAKRVGADVITMRYRVTGPNGRTRYFIGTPYRLDQLLAPANPQAAAQPWTFAVRDTRDGTVLGVVDHGRVRFAAAPAPASGVRVPVADVPLQVQASWPAGAVRQAALAAAPRRWAFEVVTLLLLVAAATWIAHLLRQRERHVGLLQRMADLQDLLAQINQEAARSDEANAFLQAVCDLAISRGRLALASVAQPDAGGRFAFPAAAGQTGYLDGLKILTDPDVPEGQGTIGRAWREQQPFFNVSFDQSTLATWRQQAQTYGLRASAALPLQVSGKPFAVLGLYRGDDLAFAPEMQGLLIELADDVSHGLERVAGRRALRRLVEFNALRADILAAEDKTTDEPAFYQQACRLAVERGLLRLAWIGIPAADGAFTALAAAGATDYLQRVPISADPNVPGGNGPTGRAWREGQPVFAQRHSGTGDDTVWARAGTASGLGAFAALPLRQSGALHAVLTLYCADTAVWDGPMRAVALDLARTIEQGLDAQRKRQQILRLERLYRALMFEGDVLLRSRSVQDMLRQTCLALTQGTPFHAVWVARPDAAGERMQAIAAAGDGVSALRQIEFRLNDTAHAPLVVQAWTTQRLVWDNNRPADPQIAPWQPLFLEHHWRSGLAVPVLRGGAVWAVLAFVSPHQDLFDEDTIALCQRVADLLGHGLNELDLRERLIEQRRGEAHRARHDALTGLPNRFILEQHVPKDIARAQRRGTLLAVGLLDLDDFKPVNDRYGHAAGDELLKQLSTRLQALLRASDLLARLGGDEFVLVLEELDPAHALQQLGTILARLHKAVEEPFDLGEGRQAPIGMSLGVALYPADGDDLDALLRKADAAMYATKARKADRPAWWGLQTALLPPATDAALDPYGPQAAELLRRTRAQGEAVTERFVQMFYADMAAHPDMRPILDALQPGELSALQRKQAQHLRFLLDPQATPQAIKGAATQVGQVHALCGVTTDMVFIMQSRYLSLLKAQWVQTFSDPRQRDLLIDILDTRLQADVQAQLRGMDSTTRRYFAQSGGPQPDAAHAWIDTVRQELAALGALPGIQAASLLQPDMQGAFQFVESAGPQARALLHWLRQPDHQPHTEEDSERGNSLMAQAWRRDALVTHAALRQAPGMQAWRDLLDRLQLRSAAAIALHDAADRPVAVLLLDGAYPHQFESPWMRQFLGNLQSRWTVLWHNHRREAALLSIAPEQARQRRRQLFSGGLAMWMQPVVDLHTAQVVKIEALARLRLPSGEVIAPAGFLPLLGEQDLARLFHLGLQQSLQALRGLAAQGLTPPVSINLPPSLLLDAQTVEIVRQTLQTEGLSAHRLELEVLESEALDHRAADAAIQSLHALGVRLSIDDLGSGYSSLLRLKSLPFDTLKVDQGLVSGLGQDPLRTLALIQSLLTISHDLDQDAVIEGLETPELIEVAVVLGARFGQGYGLARPMPPEDLQAWVQTFRLPVEPGVLRTAAGALAYHWMFMHGKDCAHPMSAADCPLTAYLQRQGLGDSDLAHAHEQVHAGVDIACNGAVLLEGLVERATFEAFQ